MVAFQGLNDNLADENLRGGLIYDLIEFAKAGENLFTKIGISKGKN